MNITTLESRNELHVLELTENDIVEKRLSITKTVKAGIVVS